MSLKKPFFHLNSVKFCETKIYHNYSGGPKRGVVDQSSPFFQEEFPTLATGAEDKSDQQLKKEEESKESQYGPGPSLRPQSKKSFLLFLSFLLC